MMDMLVTMNINYDCKQRNVIKNQLLNSLPVLLGEKMN